MRGLIGTANFFVDDAGSLFVMSPHSNNLDGPYFLQDLIDKPVLYIDAT
jgi:hypothetical protein